MEQPKVERTLRLMRLMSGNVHYTVDELARKLDTTKRSIYRYIDTFKICGFAVEKVYGSVYRLMRLPSQYRDIQNLVYFSEEEARVVNGLIENLDATNTLKINLHKKLAAIYDVTSIADYVDKKSNAANVQALGNAIRDKQKAILKDYSSSHTGLMRDRLVEPFGFTTNFIDVWAYDIEDGKNKLFKISRIDWVDIVDEDWDNEEKHEKGFLDIFRMQSFNQTHVRLEMTMLAKNLLCEEFPLASQEVVQEGDKWVLDTMVSAMEGVGRFVIGLAKEVKIVDSQELVAYVRSYIKDFVDTL